MWTGSPPDFGNGLGNLTRTNAAAVDYTWLVTDDNYMAVMLSIIYGCDGYMTVINPDDFMAAMNRWLRCFSGLQPA